MLQTCQTLTVWSGRRYRECRRHHGFIQTLIVVHLLFVPVSLRRKASKNVMHPFVALIRSQVLADLAETR